MVLYIKNMLSSMDDGRISISPYDTAWFALIKNVNGSDSPQFPASLDWIAENQLPDGSWGDADLFSAYDRLVNTLACVVALETWKVHPVKCAKGVTFINKNMCKLEKEDLETMTCGFEVIFPPLLDRARNMGIDVSCDTPYMKEIYAIRDLKIKRIPKDLMHTVPTALLHNLEGLQDLKWEKLLNLKNIDGSFLTSPSSTAFAFMETNDERCFSFINGVASKFNGGAPAVYPVDLYARLFAVDRLQRLGISRYFYSEIKECLDYVYRFWTEKGVFSARNSNFCDLDDTSMGFRLLRLHGYNMSPDVFKNFKKDDKFCCYPGQIMESPSPIFNLYRASQVLYTGEKILEEAKTFAHSFLQNWLASDRHLDKWVIAKDLPSEVKYALEVPWYANLPRVETRLYIEKYGGANDIWIGKSLYRMPEINDNVYLELAKLDYNKCQNQHLNEWADIREWYTTCNVGDFGLSPNRLLHAFFLAMASIFEPERSKERFAWTKSFVFSEMIKSCFKVASLEEKKNFVLEFRNRVNGTTTGPKNHPILSNLLDFLHQLSLDAVKEQGVDIRRQLLDSWENWLTLIAESSPSGEEAELLVHTINLYSGRMTYDDTVSHLEYFQLSKLTNKICHQFQELKNKKVLDTESGNTSFMPKEVDADMQELVEIILQNSTISIPQDTKQTFLSVAKAFYYSAYCDRQTIDFHISKALFQPIL
ncbi:hypothetical protein ACH5RR_025342 [Cinchona calisaya]|uniref:Copalyl diphosphate synthase n=1 Tax=Cinchona calisaya TaxID=153742 RepID=A0ABD2Z2Q3_9GENT